MQLLRGIQLLWNWCKNAIGGAWMLKINDEIILNNDKNRIYRKVRIKKLNQKDIVFDYGEDSAFDIKYSYVTGLPLHNVFNWNDFKVNALDLEQLKLVMQENSSKSDT